MSNESGFSWKYLIPGYGIYLIKKSEMQGKGKFIALNVVIILFVLGLMGGGSEETTSASGGQSAAGVSDQSDSSQQADGQKPQWKVGDTIKTDKFEITFSSVNSRGSVGGEFMNERASDGAVFVIVSFRYKNITKESANTFSLPEVKIIDPNGTKYDEAVGPTGFYQAEAGINVKAVSDLNPGITQKDATVFEVSKELWKSKGWKLAVDADDDFEVNIK